jgi:hypothetical protein
MGAAVDATGRVGALPSRARAAVSSPIGPPVPARR